MDWLNIHNSTLDSPEFVTCDPTRRATWLMLLRFCAGQENGGRIAGCGAWGDTTWQQMARVRLREVRAKSPLWSWEDDALTVHFYPVEKELEVKQNRENGRRGGRPVGRKDNHPVNHPVTDNGTTRFDSAKTEGNGREGKGKEGEAAAAPPCPAHAQPQPQEQTDTTPAPPTEIVSQGERAPSCASDPLAMDRMQQAPPAKPVPADDWIAWKRSRRIFIARSDESGNQDEWRDLFRHAGSAIMTEAYNALIGQVPPRHGLGYTAIHRWIFDHYQDPAAP